MKVIHNDFLVSLKGAMFAITDGRNIYIDDNFYVLSRNLKKFVLKHEEGHIALNHCHNNMYKGVFSEEEADEYAFRHTSVEATQEFIELLSLVDNKISKSRVANLKGLIAEQSIIDSGDEDRINTLLELLDEAANLWGSLAEELRAIE